jgi:anaerobic C4-dicarboxylate transporter
MLSLVIFLMSVVVVFSMTAVSSWRLNMKGNTVSAAEITIRDTDITPLACRR